MGEEHMSLVAPDPVGVTLTAPVNGAHKVGEINGAGRDDIVVLADVAGPFSYPRVVKPALDFLVALLLVLIVAPVLVLLTLAVRFTMGAPVFLRQERVGKGGERFRVWKFRTMAPDRRLEPHAIDHLDRRVCHKTESDPRITPVGRFLRKWSLDELPQLFNVVFGHMSLVGPRPELPFIVDSYEAWQHRRHDVRPGITGLWQISLRGDTLMHEATHVDLEYVDAVSFRTDAKILLKTPVAALGSCRGF